jgi:hypothetical protein
VAEERAGIEAVDEGLAAAIGAPAACDELLDADTVKVVRHHATAIARPCADEAHEGGELEERNRAEHLGVAQEGVTT